MSKRTGRLITVLIGFVIVTALVYLFVLPRLGFSRHQVDLGNLEGSAERGEIVLRAGGCITCHTDTANDGDFLAGGAKIDSPFGTFYGPNITSDRVEGIGSMSLQEFFDAMTAGIGPDNKHYFPSFPYTSYTRMSPGDVVDLKAYLDTVEPVATVSRPHQLMWPFSDRRLLGAWKVLYHRPQVYDLNANESDNWNRGAYLIHGPGHCAECHSARNILGGITGTPLNGAGSSIYADGAPALAGKESTIQDWTLDDLVFYFTVGLTPDGDSSGGKMTDVIEHGTSHLSEDDLTAMATYLLSLQN